MLVALAFNEERMNRLTGFEQSAVWVVLGMSLLGIAYAFYLRAQILSQDKGTARMQEVWGFIKSVPMPT